jgi:hypothetical protein
MRRGPLVTLSPTLTIQFGTRAASDAYEDHFVRASAPRSCEIVR